MPERDANGRAVKRALGRRGKGVGAMGHYGHEDRVRRPRGKQAAGGREDVGVAKSVCNVSLPGIFDTGAREHQAPLGPAESVGMEINLTKTLKFTNKPSR